MAKAKRYSTEQIQAAQKQLCALTAKKSGKTKKEVVALLAEDVCKAVKEGHSLKDIQETLRQSDIPVSLARLKALLGETEAGGLHTGHGGSARCIKQRTSSHGRALSIWRGNDTLRPYELHQEGHTAWAPFQF